MTRPRLAFLDTSHGDSSTSRNFRRELDADLVGFDMTDDRFPDHFDYGGVVTSGSSSPVYWDEPWIRNLVSWVADTDEHGAPLLGVCFGRQVVTAALSGTVEGMGTFELDYNEVGRTCLDDESDIPTGIGERFIVFISYGDRVTELPSGTDLLAENGFGVHAFRRSRTFGVQFHPEYDADTAEAIARQKDFLPDERIRSVVDGITPEGYTAACETKRLFDNFVTYVNRISAGSVESTT